MNSPQVRFLGSGDAFGSGGRFQACILLSGTAGEFLLDCGASSLIAMRRFGVEPNEIDGVVVSHFHGDHFGGIPFLILDGQFGGRTTPLRIAGPPGVEERVTAAQEALYPDSSKTRQRFAIDFIELAERRRVQVGALAVTAFPAAHHANTAPLALRVEIDDRVVAYSGDTAWTDALVEASAGADLFICEMYAHGKDVPFHLNYGEFKRHRSALSYKRLILTHASAEMLERRAEIDAEVAEDGLEIAL
jgi:ribonuclease BN (tRNA processing enzyme)